MRKVAEDITPDYPNLKELIENMFETMVHADGVGPVSYTHLSGTSGFVTGYFQIDFGGIGEPFVGACFAKSEEYKMKNEELGMTVPHVCCGQIS